MNQETIKLAVEFIKTAADTEGPKEFRAVLKREKFAPLRSLRWRDLLELTIGETLDLAEQADK